MLRRKDAGIALGAVVSLAGGVLFGQLRAPGPANPRPAPLRTFNTPYYVLHTDLGEAEAREADLRMTRMFEEYARRTAGFINPANVKMLPFFLYRNAGDYYAAGGPQRSAGVFISGPDGSKLMAIAGQRANDSTWHTIQHEGFHQFVHAAIPGPIPPWANEGLAEYFGEALFTGDGFISGLIPNSRLLDVRDGIRGTGGASGRFKPFTQMMNMTSDQWGDNLQYSNYDQAWAMVHFLIEADGGKYEKPFEQFMLALSRGITQDNAWDNAFGRGSKAAFEQRWAQWWMALPEHPTRAGYMRATVSILTSFLARATLQKQTYADAEAFFKEFHPADLNLSRETWLPPALFADATEVAGRVGTWSIDKPTNQLPRLICIDEDKTRYTGAFVFNGMRIGRVAVDASRPQRAAPRREPPRREPARRRVAAAFGEHFDDCFVLL